MANLAETEGQDVHPSRPVAEVIRPRWAVAFGQVNAWRGFLRRVMILTRASRTNYWPPPDACPVGKAMRTSLECQDAVEPSPVVCRCGWPRYFLPGRGRRRQEESGGTSR